VRDSPTPSHEIPGSTDPTSPVGDALGGYNMHGVEYGEHPRFISGQNSLPAHCDVAPHGIPEQSPDLATQRGDGPGKWKATPFCGHDPRLTIVGNPIRTALGDEGPRRKGSRHGTDIHSGDFEYERVEIAQSVDIPQTSPEPSARSRADQVIDQLARSSSDCKSSMQKGSRSKPNSKTKCHGAPMWPYDRITVLPAAGRTVKEGDSSRLSGHIRRCQ